MNSWPMKMKIKIHRMTTTIDVFRKFPSTKDFCIALFLNLLSFRNNKTFLFGCKTQNNFRLAFFVTVVEIAVQIKHAITELHVHRGVTVAFSSFIFIILLRILYIKNCMITCAFCDIWSLAVFSSSQIALACGSSNFENLKTSLVSIYHETHSRSDNCL